MNPTGEKAFPSDGETLYMERDGNAFWVWARDAGLPLHMAESGTGRFHADDRTEWAWQAWCAALLPASGAVASGGVEDVPEGWRLVPVEPTPEMIAAHLVVPEDNPGYFEERVRDNWQALLAASPPPPETRETRAELALREAQQFVDDQNAAAIRARGE